MVVIDPDDSMELVDHAEVCVDVPFDPVLAGSVAVCVHDFLVVFDVSGIVPFEGSPVVAFIPDDSIELVDHAEICVDFPFDPVGSVVVCVNGFLVEVSGVDPDDPESVTGKFVTMKVSILCLPSAQFA